MARKIKENDDAIEVTKSSDINYKKCPMKFYEHVLVYIVISILGTAVLYVFYHNVFISVIVALAAAVFLEKSYANGRIIKRRKKLRIQFCDMLESMSVASRAGNTELHALEAALKDLKLTYSDDADIIVEVTNILNKYRNGIQLRVLFKDFAERSGIDDIMSFAQIFEVIEGKSNKFAIDLQPKCNKIHKKLRSNSAGERKPKRFLGRLLIRSTTV